MPTSKQKQTTTNKTSNAFIKSYNQVKSVQQPYNKTNYSVSYFNKGMPNAYKAQTVSVKDLNKGMPNAYKAQTVTADTYNGLTYDPQEYVSNYKTTDYKNTYKPTEFTDLYTPGQYQSKYMPQIESALNNVTNWKYDPLQDASYQALAAVYGARGNTAARNSLADAAALNGGYGTSNAVSAAQQARNQYNQELAAMIPDLENAAYGRATTGLNALMDMDNTLYGRFSDDEQRQLAAKQFGLNVADFNNGNRLAAAQLGLEYDKLNQAEKQFVEQNAQNIWNMNRDDLYRAVTNDLDIFNTNTANKQWAEQFNQGERQYANDSVWDRYNSILGNKQYALGYNQGERQYADASGWDRYDAINGNKQYVAGMNQGERQFAWNARSTNTQQAAANAWDYLQYLEQQQAKAKASSGSGGGGGRGRKRSGGGGYSGGSSGSGGSGNNNNGPSAAEQAVIMGSGKNQSYLGGSDNQRGAKGLTTVKEKKKKSGVRLIK